MQRHSKLKCTVATMSCIILVGTRANADVSAESKSRAAITFSKLPLSFQPNEGQTDPRVKFLTQGSDFTLFLTTTGAVLSLGRHEADVLQMDIVGANPAATAQGLEQLPGKINYFIGSDPSRWRTQIPNYNRVKFSGVYPGVDLVYYGKQAKLEYDWIISPGAEPRRIQMSFPGANKLAVDTQGDLVITLGEHTIREKKPLFYQTVNGNHKQIAGRYVLRGRKQVVFEVGSYDTSKPLVIDPTVDVPPVLTYSTYLGGANDDIAYSIDVDSNGFVYIAGSTSSPNFPISTGPLQGTLRGQSDAFIVKTDITGTLVYATYLGGSSYDNASGIAVNRTSTALPPGNGDSPTPEVYVVGNTHSVDFPVTRGPIILGSKQYPGWQQQLGQPGANCTASSCTNAFVTRLDSNGFLIFSTYLGDTQDYAHGVAVDSNGSVYVTGSASSGFPTYPPAPAQILQRSPTGSFVTKLASTGAPVYSTFFPTAWTALTSAIAVDANGSAYLTGMTGYDGLATPSAYQNHLRCPAFGCQMNAFVAKLSPNGSSLDYFTYLGAGQDAGNAIDVDGGGNAYVTGYTMLSDFPITPGAPEPAFANGCSLQPSVCAPILGDAFVTEVNATGTGLIYSTFLGGDMNDSGQGIRVDAAGYAYVAGWTGSESTLHDPFGFPAINADAVQPLNHSNYHDASGGYHLYGTGLWAGCCDAFLVKITPGATSFEYSTFLGGFQDDQALAVAIDGTGNAWLAGYTNATDFPVKNALQNSLGGGEDAFVALITAPNDSRPGSGGGGGGGKGGGGGCGGKICQ